MEENKKKIEEQIEVVRDQEETLENDQQEDIEGGWCGYNKCGVNNSNSENLQSFDRDQL